MEMEKYIAPTRDILSKLYGSEEAYLESKNIYPIVPYIIALDAAYADPLEVENISYRIGIIPDYNPDNTEMFLIGVLQKYAMDIYSAKDPKRKELLLHLPDMTLKEFGDIRKDLGLELHHYPDRIVQLSFPGAAQR